MATTGNAEFGGAHRYGNLLTLGFAGAFDRRGLLAAGNATAPQNGIRNPDNLVWPADGFIYVQEDRAVSGGTGINQCGAIDPITNPGGVTAIRWAVLVPTAVPIASGQTNLGPPSDPANVGNREASAILEVSAL